MLISIGATFVLSSTLKSTAENFFYVYVFSSLFLITLTLENTHVVTCTAPANVSGIDAVHSYPFFAFQS